MVHHHTAFRAVVFVDVVRLEARAERVHRYDLPAPVDHVGLAVNEEIFLESVAERDMNRIDGVALEDRLFSQRERRLVAFGVDQRIVEHRRMTRCASRITNGAYDDAGIWVVLPSA